MRFRGACSSNNTHDLRRSPDFTVFIYFHIFFGVPSQVHCIMVFLSHLVFFSLWMWCLCRTYLSRVPPHNYVACLEGAPSHVYQLP